jgi:hypothetical protein
MASQTSNRGLNLLDISFILVLVGFLGYDSPNTIHRDTWGGLCFIGILAFIGYCILEILTIIIERKKRKKNGRR